MKRFQCTIVTPQGVYFDGTITSLVVPGEAGSFGVLADHAPIISSIVEGILTLAEEEEKQLYQIGPGLIDVLNNRATLLTTTIKGLPSA